MKNILLILIFFIAGSDINAQNNQKPCSAPEAGQFDFWVGTWDLYSSDTLNGVNTIHKIMDGCTVQENFENARSGYSGKSWSVYNPQAKAWQQTWVDNQGGYIALNGKFENGAMTLFTAPRKLPNGKEMINRMLFHNIKSDGFDWDWDSSTDNGATWKNGWHIRYVRKK
jgi:hypothetical protein